LDPTGLANRIYAAMYNIDYGRRAYAIIGKEREGRIAYEDGIATAMSVFKEASTIADPQTLLIVEYTFLTQEKQLCDKSDKDTSLHKTRRFGGDRHLNFYYIVYQGETYATTPNHDP